MILISGLSPYQLSLKYVLESSFIVTQSSSYTPLTVEICGNNCNNIIYAPPLAALSLTLINDNFKTFYDFHWSLVRSQKCIQIINILFIIFPRKRRSGFEEISFFFFFPFFLIDIKTFYSGICFYISIAFAIRIIYP